MTPEMETAVMRESEDALKELIQAFKNVGLPPASIILMLNDQAEKLRQEIN